MTFAAKGVDRALKGPISALPFTVFVSLGREGIGKKLVARQAAQSNKVALC